MPLGGSVVSYLYLRLHPHPSDASVPDLVFLKQKKKKKLQGNATCQQLDVGMLEDRSNRAVAIKGTSLLYQKGTVGRESSQANRALCLLPIGTFVHSLTHRSCNKGILNTVNALSYIL